MRLAEERGVGEDEAEVLVEFGGEAAALQIENFGICTTAVEAEDAGQMKS